MSVPTIDLARHEEKLRPQLLEAIENVAKRSFYILGQETVAFEKEFATYCESKFAVSVGCGTDGIHLTLHSLGVGPGDIVVTVANTAVPTVMAIRNCGATPLFVDIDEGGTMSHRDLLKTLQSLSATKPKAIIPVHLYGSPAKMDEILRIGQQYAIPVVEDACQAHGALYKGKKVGSLGYAGCFSFYPTKNLGCWGNGGIVITDDKELAEKLHLLRNLGQEKKYYHVIEGFNSQLDEIQAAILRIKLPYLNEWNDMRRQLAAHYSSLLEGLPYLSLPVEVEWAHQVYHQYVIRCEKRDELRAFLAKAEIGTAIHYPRAVHLQKAYRYFDKGDSSLGKTEKWCAEVLSLPLFPGLTEGEVEEVVQQIKNFLALEST